HKNPDVLGLNINKDEVVKLRARSDTYDEVHMFLCHELVHNMWGDHDNDVHSTLISQLTKEVATLERAAHEGAHTLNPRG
ncbi:hypothetical protein FA95DRAFT_1493162, partial [Auriscalpium vulgare]